jgi:hypothetical protein
MRAQKLVLVFEAGVVVFRLASISWFRHGFWLFPSLNLLVLPFWLENFVTSWFCFNEVEPGSDPCYSKKKYCILSLS